MATLDQAIRYILPAYLVVYFLTAFVWPTYRVWKTTGINPFVLGSTDSAHDFIGRVFKLVFALLVVVVVVHSASTEIYVQLMPLVPLQRLSFRIVGLTLLIVSLVWTLWAQAQMGESWRIGIDRKHKTGLVRGGVFRISRNPIFLGMVLTLTGLFFTIPNVLTLLALVVGIVVIQIQVRLEEEYLRTRHGEKYVEYCRSVRRWL